MRIALLPFAVATLVAACTTPAEFSYLNGYRWSSVEMNTYDARIVSVDGYTRMQNARLFVAPGMRTIVLEAPPAAGFTSGELRELVISIEPCTQYWCEAKRVSPLSQDWEPRVNYSDRIPGCKSRSN